MNVITNAVLGHKRLVVVVWLALAIAGLATVSITSSRLSQSFALPGQPAYEANAQIQRLFHGGGAQEPTVVTLSIPSGATVTSPALAARIGRTFAAAAGDLRVLDQATTGDRRFQTTDHRTAYAVIFTPPSTNPGQPDFESQIAHRLSRATPSRWSGGVTGIDQLTNAGSGGGGAGVFVEIILGAAGALIVLTFVFASFLAFIPLLMAAVAIPTSFLLVLALTTVLNVSFVVQFLLGLIGLGVAIDYSLLVVTRWREARDQGAENDAAVRVAMHTAGRSVVLSGLTVAVSLLALVLLPVPYLQSIGFAGFFIPLTSIAVAITLLPVLLATIGPRVDRRRLRHEQTASRPWTAWAGWVVHHRILAAVAGVAVIVGLAFPFFSIRLGSPDSSSLAQHGPAHATLATLTSGGAPPGVITPIEVLVAPSRAAQTTRRLDGIPGIALAAAPAGHGFRTSSRAVLDVIPSAETSTPAGRTTLQRLKTAVAGRAGVIGVGGTGAEDVAFTHAVYGNFWIPIAVIAIVTLLLLGRALRSIVLAVKAVVLNLLSIGAGYGVMTFVWQQGHGSHAIWGVPATGSITIWVPVAVYAFLFGLSMDYEVFILTRMREAYDETGSTDQAVVTGLARTGRLVTSAALILFLAFVSLASGPETNIKILATGLGAGILVDAVVVRSLLVPALVTLLGRWNWYFPDWLARGLRVPVSRPPILAEPSAAGPGG